MYNTTDDYKSKIYDTVHFLKVYINDTEIDSKYILDCKPSNTLFTNEEIELGSTPAQTVELKLYKSAVPTIINKVELKSGITGEIVPLGIYNVDKAPTKDDYTVTLTLSDNMTKFEFNYDGSKLINDNSGKVKLIQVLQDICQKAGVELGSTSFLNMNKEVAVYDNTVKARTYISYIAEQAGGFAVIGRDGKLYIRSFKYASGKKIGEGKIFNPKVTTTTANGITVSQEGKYRIKINGNNTFAHAFTFDEILSLEKDEYYTVTVKKISGSCTKFSPLGNWGFLFYPDGDASDSPGRLEFLPSDTVKNFTFKSVASNRKPFIWFGWLNGSVVGTNGVFNNLILEISIVKGKTALDYEDYTIIESEAEMQVNFARAEIPFKYFQNFEWGAKYKLSKIRYEDGIRVFEKGDDTGNILYINPDNMFIVDQEQVDNIYEQVKDLELYSFKGDSIIDPAIDIGDIVIIDGKPVIYQGSCQYSGRWKASINSEIKSKARQETTVVKKPSQKTINRRVQSSINQIDGKIEQLVEENTETSEKVSKHEQDIDSIKDTVGSMEEFARDVSSYRQLHLTDTADYDENLVLTLKIFGDTEKWKETVPSTLLAPGVTVAPFGTSIDLIVDSQDRTNPSENKKVFTISYGKKLRNVGNVRDELDIINNKVSIVRRIGLNDDGQEYVLDKEQIEELGELKLPTLKDDTYIYVREYPDLEYFCRYIVDNEYIKKFATQEKLQQATVELNTKIEQTNQEIILMARKKVGKDEVIASINLTPEKAKILAKLIELEGIVTANQNFKILLDGSMEATNGKFTGGKIQLENGSSSNPTFLIGTGSTQSFLTNEGFYANSNTGKAYFYVDDSDGKISILGSSGETFIRPNKVSTTGEMWATAYNYQSQAKLKENIVKFQREALYMIKNSDIYEFNYKNNSKEKTIGLVIGDGYNTPQEIISNKKGINSYSMVSISWKAIQELDKKIEKMINILKKIPIFGRIFTKRWKSEKDL